MGASARQVMEAPALQSPRQRLMCGRNLPVRIGIHTSNTCHSSATNNGTFPVIRCDMLRPGASATGQRFLPAYRTVQAAGWSEFCQSEMHSGTLFQTSV